MKIYLQNGRMIPGIQVRRDADGLFAMIPAAAAAHADTAADVHADAELEQAQSRTDAARDNMIAAMRTAWQTAGTNRANVCEQVHNLAAELRGAV